MQAMSDMALVREYALRKSEEAFATLVSRHIDLVYSAALRQAGNHHLAQEITQAVFVVLARKARSLSPKTVLPGWLFQTARLTGANYLRSEIRRVRREQEAYMQSNPSENAGDVWQQVAPMLNDVVSNLREKDRNAIVLRFLKGKDYKEVATAMGGTEAAAQMRVSRALERLRKLFAKRGVVLSAAALGGVMTAQGVQAAPMGLAATVAATAVQGTALTASTLTLVEGTLKIMAWTKVKFAIGASAVALLAYQYHQNAVQAEQFASAREDLRAKVEALAAQEGKIAELEQQTASISETRRSQEQELKRLRARRKEAGKLDGAQPAGGNATTLLSATLQDPEARAALRQGLVNIRRSWLGPLVDGLKLDPQKAEKLFQISTDWSMKDLEAVAAFTDGKITAEAAVQAGALTKQDGANQVRLLLGETDWAKFEEYERAFPAQSLVEQFNKQLGPFPLNAYQLAALSGVIQGEPLEVTSGLVGELTLRALVFPDELQRRFEQQSEVNSRILQKAAEFLQPDQVEALRLMQASNLSTQKRNILRMLWKL
jgi:RNA polymerase sigma factor (sigma-70 family)